METLVGWLKQQEASISFEEVVEKASSLVFGGTIDEEKGMIIEVANQAFEAFCGNQPSFPCEIKEVFGNKGPLDYEVLVQKAQGKGWSEVAFELVPGSLLLKGNVFSFGNGRIMAFLDDVTDKEICKRLIAFKDKYFELVKLYGATELLQGLISAMLEVAQAEWGGIFVWDAKDQRWVLQFDAVLPPLLGRKDLKNYLDFVLQLGNSGEERTSWSFGGLNIIEGAEWKVPWIEVAGSWKDVMERHGVHSLKAGTLITGASPAVFVVLSGENGKLGNINSHVIDSFWAVTAAILEKNRVMEGMSQLYHRDPVTGFYSSARLKELVKLEVERSMRYGYPLSFVAMNIDDIVSLSETETIDESLFESIIKELGKCVRGSLRSVDIVGRLGNVLLLILPHTPREGAELVANRLKQKLEGLRIGKYSLKPVKINVATFGGDILESKGIKEFLLDFGINL